MVGLITPINVINKLTRNPVLTIEKLVAGGRGLGRLADGCTVLVGGVLPGEEVRVLTSRRHRHYLEAELKEIITPSPQRRSPPCPWFGRCGGCDWQQAEYPAQLAAKQQILVELLERAGLARAVLPVLAAPAAAPAEFHYRGRIRLQLMEGRVGYFQTGSHQLQEVESCLLAHPAINQLWQQLRGHPAWRQLAGAGRALELSFDPGSSRVVLLLHHQRRPRPAELQAAGRLCRELPGLKGLGFLPVDHAAGPYLDRDSLPAGRPDPRALRLHFAVDLAAEQTLSLAVEPAGFSQVNEEQNCYLRRRLSALLEPNDGQILADLHCGMGNFSLPLAPRLGQVYGFDLQAAAIRAARANAEENRVTNCRYQRAADREALAILAGNGIRPDILLLDPPRAGCAELLSALSPPYPPQIAMISCDPATMVRDLATLQGHGYQVASLQLVDMFPQTHHLETIALLRR